MMRKKYYTTPRCTRTRVVLEQGLCQSSGDSIDGVEIKTGDKPVEVIDYTSIGGSDGFNDIGFN